jgi:tRNA wybutosine-synthesizing protein 3
MAASLKHAQPVLAAAASAGFRESGLQSLRNLDDKDLFPIVAVRSSGLALESIVGIREYHSDGDVARSLVSEEYLRMLVDIAHERFKTNTQRVDRFRTKLMELQSSSSKPQGWEDPDVRRARKRMEGLQRKKDMEAANSKNLSTVVDEDLGFPEI